MRKGHWRGRRTWDLGNQARLADVEAKKRPRYRLQRSRKCIDPMVESRRGTARDERGRQKRVGADANMDKHPSVALIS